MELLIQHRERVVSTETTANTLTVEAHALSMNLENHLGEKVKASFLPNQYYDEKIYTLGDYSVTQDTGGLTVCMKLKDGDVYIDYKLEDVFSIEHHEYFNRIEYKAHVGSPGLRDDIYNFCLYI